VLEELLSRLDATVDDDPRRRLIVVAGALADVIDAPSWFVSFMAAGSSRLKTVASSVSRGSNDGDYYLVDEYDVDGFPASYAALTGQCIVVDVDDPRSDPAEASLLMLGGLSELVMSGGVDPRGDHWMIEVCGDDLSAPVRPYVAVLRAGVALALRR
jgi:hypothetical protein